eukprot:COSAG01_NODE_12914_length_1662_cov_1.602556_1_plen_432_part_01
MLAIVLALATFLSASAEVTAESPTCAANSGGVCQTPCTARQQNGECISNPLAMVQQCEPSCTKQGSLKEMGKQLNVQKSQNSVDWGVRTQAHREFKQRVARAIPPGCQVYASHQQDCKTKYWNELLPVLQHEHTAHPKSPFYTTQYMKGLAATGDVDAALEVHREWRRHPLVTMMTATILLNLGRLQEQVGLLNAVFAEARVAAVKDGAIVWSDIYTSPQEEGFELILASHVAAVTGSQLLRGLYHTRNLEYAANVSKLLLGKPSRWPKHLPKEQSSLPVVRDSFLVFHALKDYATAAKLFKHVNRHAKVGDMLTFPSMVSPFALDLEASGEVNATYMRHLDAQEAAYQQALSMDEQRRAAFNQRAASGGWTRSERRANDPLMHNYSGCGIERVDAAELGQKQFMKEYVRQGKPVILSGLIDKWLAMDAWKR